MKFTVVLLAFAAAVSAAPFREAPLYSAESADVVPGKYLVVLEEQSNSFVSHYSWLASKLASSLGSRVDHYFDMEGFKGYSGKFDDEMIDELRTNPDVKFIEQEQYYYAVDVQPSAPWGLDRIDQRNLPLDGNFNYMSTAGKGVDVYVIDTGININHIDFGGRAFWGATIPSGDSNTDGNGHGTHVASTIVGSTYGVAKKANVFAVKVLKSNGSGTTGDVVKGIEWVTKTAKSTGRRSVANMSLGGGKSAVIDNAVAASVESGVTYAVAAGNDNANACNSSPANVPVAIRVGASNKKDVRASFSNIGPCVDIFAPGEAITAAWIGSTTALNTISGTSMASPHVAGVATLLLGQSALTPAQVKSKILSLGTNSVLTGVPTNTVNKLLFIQ